MDGVGCSLGVGMMPPKELGTVAVSTVQGHKPFQQLLQNPLPFLVTTPDGYKAAKWNFPYLEFTLWACVCVKSQCRLKGLLGKTPALLN